MHGTHQTHLFATSATGAFWMVAQALYDHGPSWAVLPPLLIGTASLLGAARSYQDGAQDRRHKDERHRAELALLAARTHAGG